MTSYGYYANTPPSSTTSRPIAKAPSSMNSRPIVKARTKYPIVHDLPADQHFAEDLQDDFEKRCNVTAPTHREQAVPRAKFQPQQQTPSTRVPNSSPSSQSPNTQRREKASQESEHLTYERPMRSSGSQYPTPSMEDDLINLDSDRHGPSTNNHPPSTRTSSNFFLNQRPNAQLEPRNRDMGCRNTESSTHERTMHSNGGQYPSPHVEDDREDNGFGRPGPSTNTQPGQQVPSTTRISSNMFPTQGPTTQLDPRRRETGSQKTEYSTYERTMHSNGGRYSARNVEGYPEVDDFSRTGPSTSSQPRHHIPTSLTTRTNSQPWQHVPNSWTSTANSQPQRQVLAPRTTRANSQPQQHNPPTWTTGESSYSFSGDQMTNSQPEVGEEDPLTCEGIITKNGARCLVPCTDHADLQEDGRYFCPKHDPRLQCHGLAITQKNRQCRRTCDPKKDHKIGNYYYCNLHSPLNKHLMCNGTKTNGEPCRYRETEVYNGMRYCKYHKHQIGY